MEVTHERNGASPARLLAFRLLSDWSANGAYPNLALKSALGSSKLTPPDKALVSGLVMGVVENSILLDYYIQQVSSIKLKKIAPAVLTILRIGAFSLKFMDRIPKSAACDECVRLAHKYCHPGSIRFVNAVMRALSIKIDTLPLPDRSDMPRYLSVRYSMSASVANALCGELGPEDTEKFLEASSSHEFDTLAVNTLKTTPDELMQKLAEKGFDVCKAFYIDTALHIRRMGNLEENAEFAAGLFYMQDEAAQIAALCLQPEPGNVIFDMCAAPGGKSFKCAVSSDDMAKITSFDIYPHKIKLIEEGARRLGLSSIRAKTADACIFNESLAETCDKILCDVPCSGVGIIGKKPDIKLKDYASFEDLPGIQLKILNNAAKYLKPGGILVYSTCTVFSRENSGVVDEFLKENGNFRMAETPLRFGDIEIAGQKTFYPHTDHTDGFYVARIVKDK